MKLTVGSSSLSLEDSEGLGLEISGDLASGRVSLSSVGCDLVEGELLLLLNLEEVDFNGVVTINRKQIG